MKFRNLAFVSVVVTVLILSISTPSQQHGTENKYSVVGDDGGNDTDGGAITLDSSVLHRSLLQKKRSRRVTCKKFPGICHTKGSPGPTCCKKKCVNVLKDRQNCGKCGKKCKYNEVCCKGRCVNPSFNAKHCGGCNNRCGNGEFCVFGLCNYA